ncbi:MAG TPA: hypothetical protein VI299_28735 [Polyangiales bacterium]
MLGYSDQVARIPAFRLGPNHGYRFEGDKAYLNAELAMAARKEFFKVAARQDIDKRCLFSLLVGALDASPGNTQEHA